MAAALAPNLAIPMRFKCTNRKCAGATFDAEEGALVEGAFTCPRCTQPCTRVLVYPAKKRGADEMLGAAADEPRPVMRVKRVRVAGVLPRCEFHPRLQGSTAFDMDQAQFWDTYARSDASRTHKKFDAPGVDTSGIKMGAYAKTGTYQNVFSFSDPYARLIALPKSPTKPSLPPRLPGAFLYQSSLEYRKLACDYIIAKLAERGCSVVINAENDYPCLLIQTPGGPTTAEFPGAKNKGKLETNQQNWTRFVMAYLVGVANHLAFSRCLPIEIVMRSSFGHLSPSVAECVISIRINVGIIPAIYADVLVDAIEMIEETFSTSFKKKLGAMPVSDDYDKLSEAYFLNILFRRAKAAKRNKGSSVDKAQMEKDLKKHKAAYVKEHYLDPTQKLPTRIGSADNLWAWLWGAGDGSGKSVLTQIVDRNQTNLEGLADEVQKALATSGDTSTIVASLPGRFRVDQKKDDGGISMTTAVLPNIVDFSRISEGEVVVHDDRFWKLVTHVMTALGGGEELKNFAKVHTVGGLYSCLEELHLEFMQREGALEMPFTADGNGSDSEEEEDLEKGVRVYSKKIITATGMRSIHLAHHAGKLFAAEQGLDVTNIKVLCDRMYYETEEALAGVPINLPLGKTKKGGAKARMLIFDLNHCNNMQQSYPKVDFSSFDVVVLDHTSSTPSLVNTYMRAAFREKRVSLVLLVASGLKNEQGGCDMNTYGTLRIVTRDKLLRDGLYGRLKDAEGTYKHPRKSHAVRRAYKRHGFVPTTKSFLNPGFSGSLFAPAEPVVFTYQPATGGALVFDVVDVAADGDCLCAALGQPTAQDVYAIRAEIVRQLEARPALIPGGMYLQVGLGYSYREVHGPDAYLAAIAQPLVWGGLTEIQAYSYVRPIIVFETPSQPRLFSRGVESTNTINWGALPENVIYVAFYGNHYAALQRR